MLMRISLGRRLTGGQHASSTAMSWKLGTPSDDSESLLLRKKSDSSLSAATGESVDEEERESSCSSDADTDRVGRPAAAGGDRACLMLRPGTREIGDDVDDRELKGGWRALSAVAQVDLACWVHVGSVAYAGSRDASSREGG